MQLINTEKTRNEIKNSNKIINENNDERSLMLPGKQFIYKTELTLY